MGEQGVGHILVMGPERDMVTDNMVDLRRLPACEVYPRLDREEDGMVLGDRICFGYIHIPRSKFPPLGSAQLYVTIASLRAAVGSEACLADRQAISFLDCFVS